MSGNDVEEALKNAKSENRIFDQNTARTVRWSDGKSLEGWTDAQQILTFAVHSTLMHPENPF